MKRILILGALALGLFAYESHAQPSGRGGAMRGPEWQTKAMWSTFCFDLNATEAQVTKAFPLFRDTILKQKALVEKYQDDPPEEARNEMKQIQSNLETKINAMLTPEQQKKLTDLEAQRQQRQQQMRDRFQGGGGPPR